MACAVLRERSVRSFPKTVLISITIVLAACSTSSLSRQAAAPLGPARCVITNQNLSPKETETIEKLRHDVEAGPLYTIPAAGGGVVTCQAGYDAGVIVLDYNFGAQRWLRVKRDSSKFRLEGADEVRRRVCVSGA